MVLGAAAAMAAVAVAIMVAVMVARASCHLQKIDLAFSSLSLARSRMARNWFAAAAAFFCSSRSFFEPASRSLRSCLRDTLAREKKLLRLGDTLLRPGDAMGPEASPQLRASGDNSSQFNGDHTL